MLAGYPAASLRLEARKPDLCSDLLTERTSIAVCGMCLGLPGEVTQEPYRQPASRLIGSFATGRGG